MIEMVLTEEQREKNKEKFLSILEPAVLSRPGSNWEKLKEKLVTSDFFTAPASTKYHCAFAGGLCYHSLNVYENLKALVKSKGMEDSIDENSIAIIALLHDLSKMNFYQDSFKNVKVYKDTGSKYDEKGRYDWEVQHAYMVIPDEEKPFVLGNHEENSEYMISCYVHLSYVESAAILNHHGGIGYYSNQSVAPKIMSRHRLVALLHIADMLATYVDEGLYE